MTTESKIGLDRPATQGNLLGQGAMIAAIGRALVKSGVLGKDQILDELTTMIDGIEKADGQTELSMDLRRMAHAVGNWAEQ